MKKKNKWAQTLITILVIIVATVSVFIFTTTRWVFKTWSNLSMNELMFHLKAPVEGTNNDLIIGFLKSTLIYVIATCITLIIVFRSIKKRKSVYNVCSQMAVVLISLSLVAVSIHKIDTELDVKAYTSNAGSESTFIEDNYVDPSDVSITFPEKKRNLIYIFMESMETTFADKKSGGDFTQNRIPELTKIANANENFRGNTDELNGGYALEGGTWTIGGMFSQTSGLPLLIPIDTNDMDMQEEFFPGTITLGDILKDEGYNQALMIGSDAEFGGRKKYFAGHGDYTMWDYEYAKTNGIIPKDYKVFWGYEDAKLFENAKTKVSEMAEKDEPFNFTMLTVDTHFEDGYLCDDCPTTFDDNYSNVYACSSHKINDFLSWLKTQDFYENTTVILNGDHLTMDSDFCENVDENTYNRKTFTSVINAPVTPTSEDRREFSTLDMFPTTLAALGAEIEGNRLGLGTNLFSENATLVEMYGKDGVNAELVRKSAFMEERTSTIRTLGSIYSEVDPQDPDSVEEARLSLERKTGSEIKAYDPEKNSFTVSIWSVPEDFPVFYAKCAVWTGDDPENQEDLQWFEFRRLKRDEDGKVRFSLTVNLDSFEDKSGTYNVHVYLMDTKGIMYNIGQLSTQIETAAQ